MDKIVEYTKEWFDMMQDFFADSGHFAEVHSGLKAHVAVQDLRDKGYLVVLWHPEELAGVESIKDPQSTITEAGNEIIAYARKV